MSLLLLLANQPATTSFYDSATVVSKNGIRFDIADVDRNPFVRLIQNFDISMTLHNRWLLRCLTIDGESPLATAYRPIVGQRILVVVKATGFILFRGTITSTEERSLEDRSGKGVGIDVSAVDDYELFEHIHVERAFGGERRPLLISLPGNPTSVQTHPEYGAHGYSTGNTVIIEGMVDSVPSTNGQWVVTVTGSTTFTIPLTTTAAGGSGTVRKLVTTKEILTWVEANLLAPYSITLDPEMETGSFIEPVTLSGTFDRVLHDQIVKATGQAFRLLPTGVLEVFAPGSKVAGFTLDGNNILGAPRITKSREGYANAIRVRHGGNALVDKVEPFSGNGVNRVFPLPYRPSTGTSITSPGHVWIGGVARHVGVWGHDTLFEWVYRHSDNSLVQLAVAPPGQNNSPVPQGTLFQFSYKVQFPQEVEVKDDALIAADGGRKRSRTIEAPNVYDLAGARQVGQTELNLRKVQPRKISLDTRDQLAFPGTTITLALPERDLTGTNWLATAVNIREEEDGALRYTYTLIEDNKLQPGWIEFFKGMARGGSSGGTTTGATAPASSSGGGQTSIGVGTPGRVPKWASNVTLSDSIITEVVGGLTIAGTGVFSAAVSATRFTANAFRAAGADLEIQNSAGTAAIRVANTAPSNVTIFNALNVNGGIRSDPGNHLAFRSGNGTSITDNIILDPGSKRVLAQAPYTVHLGAQNNKYLSLWCGELWVETLVAQETIATIGGTIVVAPTTTLVADVTSGQTTITVKHNNLKLWDSILLQTAGKLEIMMINTPGTPTGSAGAWTYNVLRNRDGSGANDWFAGDAIVNTGTPVDPVEGFTHASGFMDIYSVRGIKSTAERGPTIVGNIRTSYSAFGWEPRWALGNLNGLYGYTEDIYGAVFGNAAGSWLRIEPGKIVGGFGNAPGLGGWQFWLEGANAWFKGIITVLGGDAARTDMSNVTTISGGKITTGTLHGNAIIAGTVVASKLSVANLSAISADLGTVVVNSSGHLRSNGATWASGTGFFLGWDNGQYKFRVGSSSKGISWDGSSFDVDANQITFGTITMDNNGIQIPSGTDSGGSKIRVNTVNIYSNVGGKLFIDGHVDIDGDLFVGSGVTELDELHIQGLADGPLRIQGGVVLSV